jgi:hypothetical protein
MPVYLVNQYDDPYAWWGFSTEPARADWNAAYGPQKNVTSWDWQAGASWMYIQIGYDGNPGPLGQGDAGITYNCNAQFFCDYLAVAMDIDYSVIYINADTEMTEEQRRETFAHEFGHGMGLDHHCSGPGCQVLMKVSGHGSLGPTTTDLGYNPPCESGSDDGIRCIYKWTAF